MAQGCHLIFSSDDRRHFRLAIPRRSDAAVREAALRDLKLEGARIPRAVSVQGDAITIDRQESARIGLQNEAARLEARLGSVRPEELAVIGEILSSWPRANVDLVAGLGNTKLSEDMAAALPGALHAVLRHTPGAPGLFSGVRKGEASWLGALKNTAPGKADGIAYEVLATRALMGWQATSREGAKLRIYPTDSVGFGAKRQGWYGRPGPISVRDGPRRSVFYQPLRRTVEADLVIRRPDGFSYREIGVDFKHSQGWGSSRVPASEIEAAWSALRTGDLDEFHFVSNTKFTQETRDKVDEINRQIENQNRRGGSEISPIELFEDVGWR